MSGWSLSAGTYSNDNLNEEEIWSILNSIFSPKSYKTTSYKYCFLKCLLDNIFNVDENLSIEFDKIYERFTEIYWNLVVRYNLCQIQANSKWKKSSVELIIENFLLEHQFTSDFSFDGLKDEFQLELIKKISVECSKYVIGAFFIDSKEQFYSFSKKKKLLIFNPSVYFMFVKYKSTIEKLNYYEWIKFLEKVNPYELSYAIANKLDYSTKRTNLSKYKEYLFNKYNQITCFYCKKSLANINIEVDHYIPWSFVKDDKLWNFVLACKDCNNKKRDKLPVQIYTNKIIERNINISSDIGDPEFFYDFKGYNDNKIIYMYQSAVFNGYDFDWSPYRIN